MKVCVFGAGHVGTVTAVCLASLGHRVTLVEPSEETLALLDGGRSPVAEPGLAELIVREAASGRLTWTRDGARASADAEVALICVGTPTAPSGLPDTVEVMQVLTVITGALAERRGPFVIALRSAVPAGQIRDELWPMLARHLGSRLGHDVGFALNPDFMREGRGIGDFMTPPYIVVGTQDGIVPSVMRRLYHGVEAPLHVVSVGTASLLKYASSAFHALKVAFANEVSALSGPFGAEADRTMELLCLDRHLNISPAYLEPRYAFGGPCLPRDVRTLARVATLTGAPGHLLDAVLASNEAVIRRSVEAIVSLGVRDVALVGLSFKPGTDDLRQSPYVELTQRLLGLVRIFDPDVDVAGLRGGNRAYAAEHLPQLAALVSATPQEALAGARLVVVGKPLLDAGALVRLCRPGTIVLDLTHTVPQTLPPLRVLRHEDAAVFAGRPRPG